MPRITDDVFCAGCGKRTKRYRLRYGAFHSQKCAAEAAAVAQEAGSGDFFCPICGDLACGRDHDPDA